LLKPKRAPSVLAMALMQARKAKAEMDAEKKKEQPSDLNQSSVLGVRSELDTTSDAGAPSQGVFNMMQMLSHSVLNQLNEVELSGSQDISSGDEVEKRRN
jgi:hypothetical protein